MNVNSITRGFDAAAVIKTKIADTKNSSTTISSVKHNSEYWNVITSLDDI
jgi:hypothetical protein